ncbi:ATP-binding protein [Candidatus Formimonas warabiya]|uniref:ATP-binding protein n=1 Tax=Formimonas warabiya TaxID=1761012 RepID=UPI001BE3D62A|nr:ATP-binding protein [Candidatus Formimonas warabiya]
MEDRINKKRMLMLSGVMISIIAAIFIFSLSKPDTNRNHPENGILDLQGWEPEQDGALSLRGQWDFYWKRFLSYQEIASGRPEPDLAAAVPGEWNKSKIDGQKLPGIGYGTYVVKVVNAPEGKPLAMRVPPYSTAYELYINDRLLSSNGKVGTSKENYAPEYRPQVVEFTPPGTSFEIIVHIANFIYSRGGMWYALSLGTPEQIHSMDRTIVNKDLFLFGALSVMALYYLSIFLLRREDKSSLYFVFMCVIFASRIVVYGDYLIYKLIPFISYHAIVTIEYMTVCYFPVSAAFMIGTLFPEENSRRVLKVVFAYAAAMTLLFLLTPISFYTGLVYYIQIAAILIGMYSIVTLCMAFLKGKKDSITVLLGALALIICAVYDMLYQDNIIVSNVGELVPLGLFILLFLQSFVLSRRFAEAFKDVRALSQKLLKLDKIKDEFLANTSHELRTPLNGILGITEAMLKGSDGQLDERQKQSLSMIAGSSRRLANLVNDILDYSKMKNGDILLNIRPIQIEGLIHTVVNVFKQLNRSKEYEIIAEIPEGLPPVLADENRVVQILYNLVGNAVKFTARGYIRLSAIKREKMLEIRVSDTGEGIRSDRLEDIFKSFEQVDTSLTRRHGGTGLGLSITKQLVELQGGSIRVESHPGEGSRFYFTLPLADGLQKGAEPAAEAKGPGRMAQELGAPLEEVSASIERLEESTRVLLVDDDPVNLQAAAAILRLGGHGVIAVSSGKAALAELDRHKDYSLMVLDVMMPEMSGYEVCRRLRESRSIFELPVLMLTAKATTEDIVMGFEAGANDYLPKPFEPEELLARVRTLTELKASVDKAMAAEVAFMQAQIKPHFLFNTLNAISALCDSDPGRAQRLIDVFSTYLRESFDFKSLEMYVPIEREMSLVSSYVEIERARFGDKLRVEFDMDHTVKIRIPLLSIQPLVENAISHGLRKKGGKGTVTISVKKVTEGVRVTVEDDGKGIPEDKLAELLTGPAGQGIGLWNTDRRLKKLLGKGLTIESVPGKGTRVAYIVPPEVI